MSDAEGTSPSKPFKPRVVKYPRKWENVGQFAARLQVPNGWIYKEIRDDNVENALVEVMIFVPDQLHQWVLE